MDEVRNNLQDMIVDRAMRDPEFRDRLTRDPRATIRQEFGVEIPAEVNLTVVEEEPASVVLVLPPTESDADSA